MASPKKQSSARARVSVHAHVRPDGGDAFFPEPKSGQVRAPDDLAEELAEEFLSSATSGEESGQERLEQIVPEENGGPFIQTSGDAEFASGTDESNPEDAEVEPFPTTGGHLRPTRPRG